MGVRERAVEPAPAPWGRPCLTPARRVEGGRAWARCVGLAGGGTWGIRRCPAPAGGLRRRDGRAARCGYGCLARLCRTLGGTPGRPTQPCGAAPGAPAWLVAAPAGERAGAPPLPVGCAEVTSARRAAGTGAPGTQSPGCRCPSATGWNASCCAPGRTSRWNAGGWAAWPR
ncbi:protein of unknown function [Streptantibioticus cattleyicolor NRRL 8057 = DSM 46488]|nr:protein of unknown function [Streptantibioticus cattleyicolor NRRL 8057 = DSM 46488]